VLLALNFGCVREHASQPVANIPPKTYFWLFPDSTIAEGISKQRLRWWGEDPDGFVIGYLLSVAPDLSSIPNPDTLRYTFVTANDTVIQFPLTQAKQTYLVAVRAVDNSFSDLPVGARIKLFPLSYWDKNANGVKDGGDAELPQLLSAVDPNAAKQKFPIRNSPPSVTFQTDPANPGQVIQQPDTTYTVASFSWIAADLDGDNTIDSCRISLNDTSFSRSFTMSSSATLFTLMVPREVTDVAGGEVAADVYTGTFPNMRKIGSLAGLRLDALNVLYLQVKDVAGDFSPRVQMPQGTKKWYVKKPKSRLLIISDYQKPDSLEVKRFYRDIFSSALSGRLANYDELDIRTGATTPKSGVLVPAILNPAFVQTLKLYDFVVWYTDQFPSLSVAQFPLYLYASSGGRVIYSTEFASAVGDPRGSLVDFAPLDSISSVFLPNPNPSVPSVGTTRIPKNYVLYGDSSVASNKYPSLEFDSLTVSNQPINFHLIFMRPVYKRTDARSIYRLQAADSRLATQFQYVGTPTLGVIDNSKRFVFLAAPLHLLNGRLNGGQGIQGFLNKVFVDEFGF
jgi:hypothetical protein